MLGAWQLKHRPATFEDLGTEAIHRMEVEDFSCIVAYDSEGNDVYKEAVKKYGR